MATLGLIISLVGSLLAMAGGIWLAVVAFQESVWWGLGCLFIPCVGLIFAIQNWDKASKPFLVAVAGALISGAGSAIASMGGAGTQGMR